MIGLAQLKKVRLLCLYVILILFHSSLLQAENLSSKTLDTRPNIIYIMADDLGYGDLGCYCQKLMKTPNIDKLAAHGIRFTQAYAGGPVCTPSRSVLMTGLHNGHTPARDNIPHYHTYLQKDDVTLAETLKTVGYRTGGLGKWSLGDPGTAGDATNQGFDMWLGYQNQDHAHYYYPEYLDDSYRTENDFKLGLPGNTESREFYSHDLLTERALQFIRDSNKDPFFLYVAFTLPHFSSKTEDPDGLTVPTTAPYADKDWPEKAKKYASMVHMLDRDVGKIVELVDQLGLSDQTLIVFTSDNGGHHAVWEDLDTSGPLRGFKRDLTEGGIRVPFIVRWPGIAPEGVISNEMIAFQDMHPTFAAIAGAITPANLDGIDISEALKGKKLSSERAYLYWDYGHNRDQYNQAVKLGDWKGIRMGQGGKIALYDLATDLGEEKDVAKKHPEIVAKMEEIMKEAVIPSSRYEVGRKYTGGPIWQKE